MWLKLLKNRVLLALGACMLLSSAHYMSHPILSHTRWKAVEVYNDTSLVDTARILSFLELFSDIPQSKLDSISSVLKRDHERGLWRLYFGQDSFQLATQNDSLTGTFVLNTDTLLLYSSVQPQTPLKCFVPSLSSNHMVLRLKSDVPDSVEHSLEFRFHRQSYN